MVLNLRMAFNTFSSGNAFGHQWFAGYDMTKYVPLGHRITFAPEIGYTSSGNANTSAQSSYKGLWADGVVFYKVNSKIKFINRLGLDFGDANGIMVGIGGQYIIDERIRVRGEAVLRSGFKSYQLNALYQF